MAFTSTLVGSHGVAVILALTPDMSDDDVIRAARDLRDGFRIKLPTGCEIAYSGQESYGAAYRIWPAVTPAPSLPSRCSDFSSLTDG